MVTVCCISELHAHLRPHHNVWPEAVYMLFYENYIVYQNFVTFIIWISISSQSFISQFSPVFEIHELKI